MSRWGQTWRVVLPVGCLGLLAWLGWQSLEREMRRLETRVFEARIEAAALAVREGLEASPFDRGQARAFLSAAQRELGARELDVGRLAGPEPAARRARGDWEDARRTLADEAERRGLRSWSLVDRSREAAWPPPAHPFVLQPPRGGAPADGRAFFARGREGTIAQIAWTLAPSATGDHAALALVEWTTVGSAPWRERLARLERRAGLPAGSLRLVRKLPGDPSLAARPPDGGLASLRSPEGHALGEIVLARDALAIPSAASATRLFARVVLPWLGTALLLVAFWVWWAGRTRRLTATVERASELGHTEGSLPSAPGELGELARAVERAFAALSQEQIERAGAERRAAWEQVARRVAHEVKNPLTPIRIAVENLERAARRGEDALREALAVEGGAIRQEVRRLERLVNEFHEFARLPPPRVEPLEILPLVREAFEAHARPAEKVTLHVECEDHALRVAGDRDLLVMAFANLARNSVEAMGGDGGALRVRIVGDDGERSVRVEVEDEGPGVPDEILDRAFEPYVTGRSSGTGLGLAIVQRIVAEHGGRIEAERGPGGGALFRVRLPAPLSSGAGQA